MLSIGSVHPITDTAEILIDTASDLRRAVYVRLSVTFSNEYKVSP